MPDEFNAALAKDKQKAIAILLRAQEFAAARDLDLMPSADESKLLVRIVSTLGHGLKHHALVNSVFIEPGG